MKKFYKENRVFVILMGVALICIAIIVAILATYVVQSSTKDTYGNRLDGINDVQIDDAKIGEMEASLLEVGKVKDVVINLHGKIVYFNIKFENDVTVEEAESASVGCLSYFEENYLNYYDLQFLITTDVDESSEEETVFPIIGYKKAGATTISWSNNAKKQ